MISLAFPTTQLTKILCRWVGDQDPTFDGLKTALTDMIHSAFRKYVGYGSDIGGYRSGGPQPFGRTVELFTRWFQV